MEFWWSTFSFKIHGSNQLIFTSLTATSLSANKMTVAPDEASILFWKSGGEVSMSSWVPVVKPTTRHWGQAQRCEVIIQTSPETTGQTTNNFHPPTSLGPKRIQGTATLIYIPSLYPCCTRELKNTMLPVWLWNIRKNSINCYNKTIGSTIFHPVFQLQW